LSFSSLPTTAGMTFVRAENDNPSYTKVTGLECAVHHYPMREGYT
jgi:hypothetical protein